MVVGIRYVASSIRKSWHQRRRQLLGRYSSLADSGHKVNSSKRRCRDLHVFHEDGMVKHSLVHEEDGGGGDERGGGIRGRRRTE
jgi:hypothetical protein